MNDQECFSWTDEKVEELKQLYNKGWSASRIGEALGCRTRNQVIGKVNRLGLTRSATVVGPRKERVLHPWTPPRKASDRQELRCPKKPLPLRPSIGAMVSAFSRKPIAEDKRPGPEPVDLGPVVATEPVTLMQLEEGMCRWPELGGLYCGCRVSTGKPYCEEHRARATRGGGWGQDRQQAPAGRAADPLHRTS